MAEEYLQQVRRRLDQQADVSDLFDPSGSTPIYLTLRRSLLHTSRGTTQSYTNLTRQLFPEYRPFADLLAAYLLFVRDADLTPDDPIATEQAYQRLENCYKAADKVFAQGDSTWFVNTLRKFTTELVATALRTGRVSGDSKLTRAGEAARMLGRPMGVAASDRSQESPSKRDALFFLANATFKVYFALHNLRLCDTVINNTANAASSLESFPKADRVAFHYYRGRIYLYQRRLPQARRELQKAFDLSSIDSPENARLIFTYLLAASLPLGILPTFEALEQFDLFEQYAHLITALQVGNYTLVMEALDNWREWHLQRGNYLLLREKLQTICWRNLIRRTLFITTEGQPLPEKGPPTLSLDAILTTARVSFADPTLDLDDIECMCASLMDQGYIKAYILHSKRLLVLQKGPLVGFPPVASVRP